jgi:alkaline phosphatase D
VLYFRQVKWIQDKPAGPTQTSCLSTLQALESRAPNELARSISEDTMTRVTRRTFLETAIALGATAAWGRSSATHSKISWREHRDFYPEGVASGDPDSNSVLLWTRRPPNHRASNHLRVEVAEDESFNRVVVTAEAPISEASDWTCRVLVGGLKPARTYW